MPTNWDDIIGDTEISASFGAGMGESELLAILTDTQKVKDSQVEEILTVLEDRISAAKTRQDLFEIMAFVGRTARRFATLA